MTDHHASTPDQEHPSARTTGGPPVLSSADDPRDRRVSLLVGDRFCINCGFNLVGQSVVREPHYDMLMVRCPECGTAAAMQEYPMLGRWAGRWARVLAAALLLFLTLFTFGTSLACWGVSVPAVLTMVEPMAQKLGEAHVKWQREKQATNAAKAAAVKAAAASAAPATLDPNAPQTGSTAADPAATSATADPATDPAAVPTPDPAADPNAAAGSTVVTVNGVVVSSTPGIPPVAPARPRIVVPADEDWWRRYAESDWAQAGEPKAVIAAAGGWASNVNWGGLKWLALELPIAFLFGAIFSVLLLGLRRWKAVLIVPVIFMLATLWAFIDKLDDSSQWGGNLDWMAADMAGFPLHIVVYLFMAYAMTMGIWSGRAIARAVVRFMLPPRLCGSLADLWLCEGRTPPYGAAARKATQA